MFAGIKKESFMVWGALPAVLIVLILWYQFGFSMGGTIEEWDFLWLIKHHPLFWNSFPGNLMSEKFAARPLQAAPFWLAHAISSNSFLGFNLLLMAACFVRVVTGAWIGFFLFKSRAYAVGTGLLFLIFPADTQQLAFRTINVSCAAALMIAGIACVMHAITAIRSPDRKAFTTLSVILCVVATLVYEPVFTLYPLLLLFIWAKYGFRGTVILLKNRRRFLVAWCLAPTSNAAYLYYAMVIYGSSYQTDAAHGSLLKAIVASAPYLVTSLAYRVFFDAWISSWWIVTTQIAHYTFISVSFLLLAGPILALSWKECANPSGKLHLRIIVSGLFALMAGYIPYMVAPSHMEITQRTFISVAPGASVVLIGVVSFVCRRRVVAGAVILCAFIMVSMVAQLYQFDQYARDYTGISLPYMSLVSDKIDRTKPVHLIIDSSGFGGHLTGMYMSKVSLGLPVRADDPTGNYWLCMNQPPSPYLLFYNCSLDNGIWTVRMNGQDVVKYSAAIVQKITVDQSLSVSYRSTSSTWHDQGTYDSTKSIFSLTHSQSYSCVADSMWGWSGFCRGNGWSDGIFNHSKFRHQNFFGAIAPTATLIFNLNPVSKNYKLEVTIFNGIDGAIVPAMNIIINGKKLSYRVINSAIVEASVPASVLLGGQNEIRFENVLPAGRSIGMLVSRIDLAPSNQ